MNLTLPFAPQMAAFAAITLVATAGCVEPPQSVDDDITVDVRLTYYHETGDPMYNGVYPHAGAAACSWDFPIGTILATANGDVLFCSDRGMLPERWVDVFVETQEEGERLATFYGPYTRMRVLSWGDDKTRPSVINRPKELATPAPDHAETPVDVGVRSKNEQAPIELSDFTTMLTR